RFCRHDGILLSQDAIAVNRLTAAVDRNTQPGPEMPDGIVAPAVRQHEAPGRRLFFQRQRYFLIGYPRMTAQWQTEIPILARKHRYRHDQPSDRFERSAASRQCWLTAGEPQRTAETDRGFGVQRHQPSDP